MLHQPSLGTFNPKTIMSDFLKLKSSKNSGVSRTIKFSQLSHPNTMRDPSFPDEQFKLVKLIGDKDQNIQDILAGLKCHCGCKEQLKKILTLLMDKIYRLREERNYFKKTVERQEYKRQPVSIGVNTIQQEVVPTHQREQLMKLIEDSAVKSKAVEVAPLGTDEVVDLIGFNRLSSITFQHQANQTNLLEQSQMLPRDESISKLSFQDQSIDKRVLQQSNNNNDNRLISLKSQCNKRSLDLGTLQNYIQKLTTAKALNKYQIERRKNSIF